MKVEENPRQITICNATKIGGIRQFLLTIAMAGLLLIGCPEAPQVINITEYWTFNQGSLGDEYFSIRIHQTDNMEGRVNGNAWVETTIANGDALLTLPLSDFQTGENLIEVRAGRDQPIISKTVWRGSYNYSESDSGTTSYNLQVSVQGSIAHDVCIDIINAKEISDPLDNESIFMITDDSGNIEVSGLPCTRGFDINSEAYEKAGWSVFPNDSVGQNYVYSLNITPRTANTVIYGKFLKTTDAGDVPFVESDGEAWLDVWTNDHSQELRILTEDASTQFIQGESVYNTETGDYSFTNFSGDKYYLMTICWPSAGINLGTAEFNVPAGTSKEVNITLDGRIGTLSGTIFDALDLPVEGCYVVMRKEINWGGEISYFYTDSVQTDENGEYTLETFYGDYTILASTTNPNVSEPADSEVSDTLTLSSATQTFDLTLP